MQEARMLILMLIIHFPIKLMNTKGEKYTQNLLPLYTVISQGLKTYLQMLEY